MAWYDFVIVVVVFVLLFLIIASRVTKQTIAEMVRSMIELIREQKENAQESYLE